MPTTIHWPDKTLPTEIHCASGVLTGLEMVAVDGLLAMPRIGLGVGGLLLGRREHGRIYVLEAMEFTCSHSAGPSFALTAEELTEGCALAAEATKGPESEVVGWYCSKTAGRMELNDHQMALFDAACPEPWQVALLMRPERGGATMAAFGFRRSEEGDRSILWGSAREMVWQELTAYQSPQTAPTPAQPEVAPPELPTPVPVPRPIQVPAPMQAPSHFVAAPRFLEMEPESRRGLWLIRILAAVAVAAMLGAAVFLTRGPWVPKPQPSMIGSSDWTGRVAVLWNGEALKGVDYGSLVIDDGSGPLHTIHLDGEQLRAGVYLYDCRPGTVAATMLAGEITDTTTFTALAPHLPASGISK